MVDAKHSTLQAPPRPPSDSAATLGLLGYVVAHALDDDYREAARTRPAPARSSRWLTVAALAAFMLLIITAASQTSRNAVADAHERADLVKQVKARRAAVDKAQTHILRLRATNSRLSAALVNNDKLSAGTRQRLGDLGVLSGVAAVRGPGVEITVDDAPGATTDRQTVLDVDLQALVNGLWQAGAEAMSINGQRITGLTAISQAGSAIDVNYTNLSRPYVVSAIGDPTRLPSRFADTVGGQTWLDLHQQVGLAFEVRTRTRLDLPAAPAPTLRSAEPAKGGTS